MIDDLARSVGRAVLVTVILLLAALFNALPTWIIVNWIFSGDPFHAPHITLLQAWGINALAGALFKDVRIGERA